MSATETRGGFKANLIERLHHPVQLRVFITATVLLVGYGGVYMPLDSSIAESTRQLTREQQRLNLARDIEHLRAEQKRFQDRLPRERDPNEWVQYLLGGIRTLPLKLVTLDAKTPLDVGPFKAIVLHCELVGSFHDMEQLLRWIEFNDRLFRIDSVKISPHRSNDGTLVLQLVVLGVMG
jgi:Tfp pilus assembly protein PilO